MVHQMVKNLWKVIESFLGIARKLGGPIFDHQVWQPKAIEKIWSPIMAIENDKKLVTKFFKHCPI
jgi:hypothetical protein